jgi:lipoic acid synthetase
MSGLHTASSITAGEAISGRRLPDWLRKPHGLSGRYRSVVRTLAGNNSAYTPGKRVHTVCVEARCPNRAECFSAGTATFLIMGNSCTRDCRFCGVHHGAPEPLDQEEPATVAAAAARLNLRHIVITSVTRDDLTDGGAGHIAETVRSCRRTLPDATIEVLIPDFAGSESALAKVLAAHPDIVGHNLETVPRLYAAVRPQAEYRQSLRLLDRARKTVTKAGLMVGLGETDKEIEAVLTDLIAVGCSMVTIGQYLQPSPAQAEVARFVTPEKFSSYASIAGALGFSAVAAGPFVRSSFHALELFQAAGAALSPCPPH